MKSGVKSLSFGFEVWTPDASLKLDLNIWFGLWIGLDCFENRL
jgi:hypothetical protein